MIDDAFEWDDGKAESNLRKHGVSFADARLAFDDAQGLVELDLSTDYGEERFRLTGLAATRLLTIAYTERADRVRIISARPATKREQNDYHLL